MPTDQILYTEEMVGAGHPTKTDTLNRMLNKLTTAGAIPYATAAQTVAALAIGAANTKLFTNAAASAPEWASGLYLGYLQRAREGAAGAVNYTDCGFKPNIVIFIAADSTLVAASQHASWGIDNATAHYCVYDSHTTGNADSYSTDLSYSIKLNFSATQVQKGYISAMLSNGFTITWAKDGADYTAGTINVIYLAIR